VLESVKAAVTQNRFRLTIQHQRVHKTIRVKFDGLGDQILQAFYVDDAVHSLSRACGSPAHERRLTTAENVKMV